MCCYTFQSSDNIHEYFIPYLTTLFSNPIHVRQSNVHGLVLYGISSCEVEDTMPVLKRLIGRTK